MRFELDIRMVTLTCACVLATGCTSDTPTSPAAGPTGLGASMAKVHAPTDVPTGERIVGNAAIEPAYNADSGELMYLLTPIKAPLPSHANAHAVSPLYIVLYPASSTAVGDGQYNCEGVPGNCPDHSGDLAGLAVTTKPSVYGTDPAAVPGHDHIGDPPGKPDFNVAWEVVAVLFTDDGVADGAVNTRLTTDAQIDAAVAAGDAITVDLGFAFNCSVVPESLYWRGTPVG